MKQDNASSTAYTVLQGLLYTGMRPQFASLVDDQTRQASEWILGGTLEGQRRLRQLNGSLSRQMLRAMESLLLPGISLHYALRKRFIETRTLKAIENGTSQVIILGAGFDTLAWRLHERFPAVNFIEIDHPATSAEKASVLREKNNIGNNLHLLAVDLSEQDLESVLNDRTVFDSSRRSLFICEGVMMYLPRPAVASLFQTVRSFSTHSELVFTAIAPLTSKNNNASWLLKLYLRFKRETINWSIEEHEVNHFLNEQGFQLLDLANGSEMCRRFLQGSRVKNIHRGEFAVCAAPV